MLRKDVARPASSSTMALRSEDPKRDSSCDGFKPKDLPEPNCSKGVFYLRAHLVSGCGYEASSAVQHRQVTINVGGLRFALPWEALADVPISRLGRLRLCSSHDDVLALCDDYDIACNEFFFDRSPCAFRAVLAFLRAGKLHLQPDSCSLSFRDELHYWGVCEEYLEPCCLRALQQRAEEDAAAEAQDTYQDTSAAAVEGATSGFIRALRDIVERPQSGLAGKVFACLSVAFVVITVVSLCVGTMPDMREEERKGTCSQKCYDIFVVETVCVAWFSLELTLRFIQAPDKCQFARSPLNMIDAIAILPYYVSLIIDAFSTSDRNFYLEKVGLVLRVLRALRMMYVMRLARHSLGLQTLGLTMRRCTHEFGLLLLFLCVALSLFAPLAFLIEKEVGNHANFTSIPASYWWAVISMTTVGYGDMVPHSFPGQLVALCGILSGILLMAFPVTSIFHSFSHSYVDLKEQYQRLRRREIREAALSPDFGPDLQTGTGMRSRTPPDLTL